MKKTIAIIVETYIDSNLINTGCGGSETWAIEISNQFSRIGYNVMLFSYNDNWYTNNEYVQYIPINRIKEVLEYTDVNWFLCSRSISEDILNNIKDYLNHNLIFVAHDVSLRYNFTNIIDQKFIEENNILKEHLYKIITLSDFGETTLHDWYNIDKKYFVQIGNGINFSYLNNINDNQERDNNIFWTSRHERGLSCLVNDILPKLKQYKPNTKVYVALYENDFPEEFKNNNDIIFLGRLNKEDLYKELSKHKVWFYPNFYPETFCISVLEAIICGNDVFTTFDHGLATTLKPFEKYLIPYYVKFDNEINYTWAAYKLSEYMDNYYMSDRILIRNIMKSYILDKYSWVNICKQFEDKIFNKSN